MIAEFVEKNDEKVQRFLEIFLGSLTWITILSPIWLGLIYPPAIVYMLTFCAVYWSFLALRFTTGMTIGFIRHKREMAKNWREECLALDYSALPEKATLPKSLDDVRHFILIPAVNEPYTVLKDCIDSIFDQDMPLHQIALIFTVEEKYAEKTIENIKDIIGERAFDLAHFLTYIHPAGIPGEAIGVGGANRTWGAKHAVEDLKNKGENLRNYIFSSLDADHVVDKQYFTRLTHLYLTADKRDNKFYSTAVHLFNNNLWRVPMMMRIEANAVTLGTLSDWVVATKSLKDSFSAYSCSLQTLVDADYWDVKLGVDDSIFYWRAFFVRNGDFEGLAHFIPYSADAVEGKNYINSYTSLYKQLLRWGWGAIDFPLSIKQFLTNKKIPRNKKVMWFFKHLQKRVLLINIVFLITFGFNVMSLINPYVRQTNFAYSLPDLMSMIMTATLVCLIPGTIVRLRIVKPMPENWPYWKKFTAILESPAIILNLLTFSFFPMLEAQTRMLLGKKMKDLYHTPKLRA